MLRCLTHITLDSTALAADDDDADTDRCIISIDRWYDGEMVEVKFFPTRSLSDENMSTADRYDREIGDEMEIPAESAAVSCWSEDIRKIFTNIVLIL